MIRMFREPRAPHLAPKRKGGRSSGPLFITRAGRRVSQPEAWKMARRIARRASLDGAAEIRPRSLRVAFITGAREAGVPLEDLQTPPATLTPPPHHPPLRLGASFARPARLVCRHVLAGRSGGPASPPETRSAI